MDDLSVAEKTYRESDFVFARGKRLIHEFREIEIRPVNWASVPAAIGPQTLVGLGLRIRRQLFRALPDVQDFHLHTVVANPDGERKNRDTELRVAGFDDLRV